MSAAFDEAYPPTFGSMIRIDMVFTMTIEPPPRRRMCGITSCAKRSEPNRLTSRIFFHASKSALSIGPHGCVKKALFTSTSTWPNCFTAMSTRRWQSSGLAMSVGTQSAFWRRFWMPSATSSSAAGVRAARTTSPPSRAQAYATSLPTPGPMPDTIATRPFKRSISSPRSVQMGRDLAPERLDLIAELVARARAEADAAEVRAHGGELAERRRDRLARADHRTRWHVEARRPQIEPRAVGADLDRIVAPDLLPVLADGRDLRRKLVAERPLRAPAVALGRRPPKRSGRVAADPDR